jgi:chromosome segregation protein
MRLKSVRIFGFKTFAERTEFTLHGGVIAVVGPNGCGKSNLVDAILWGLGESNVRHLRAANSQEVIFSGSPRRKGVGYCEVTLLFDNEDGALPMDSPEVSVSRRLSRNGDSEFCINRRNCRQRDVFELLADSGLGRTGYAIIGQRQVDSALNASSEERRAWVDEAAGVQRYRQRKLEALRKLEAAKDHLNRVADILAELDSQREPLREQAEQASDYRRIQSALRETEVNFLSSEAAEALGEILRFKEQAEVGTRWVVAETFRAESEESGIAQLTAELAELEKTIDAERSNEQVEQTAVAKSKSDIRLFETRLEALGEQELGLSADRDTLLVRIDQAENDVKRCVEDFQSEEERVQEIRKSTSGSTEEVAKMSEELDEAERQLRQATARETQRVKRQLHRESLLEKRGRDRRELATLLATFEPLIEGVQVAKDAHHRASEMLESLKHQMRALLVDELALKSEEEEKSRELRGALYDRAALEGRERGIEETINGFESLSQGARAVLDASFNQVLSGKYESVGQVIQADKRFAMAIETGLGAAINDLIVDGEKEAREAIDFLKSSRSGRATFQPISLMRAPFLGPELQTLLSRSGVLGIASELVRSEPKYRPVLDSLLGKTLVVENLKIGLGLAKTKGWSKIATLDGELILSSGAVTGGANSRQSYGIVQRKADLSQLRKQIDGLTERVEAFHRGSADRQKAAVEIGSRLGEIRRSLGGQEDIVSEAKSYLRTLEDEMKVAIRDRERLEREVATEIPSPEAEPVPVDNFANIRDLALKALATQSADAQFAEERLREADKRLLQSKQRLDAAYRRREQEIQAETSRERKAERVIPERNRLTESMANEKARLEEQVRREEAARHSLVFLGSIKAKKIAEREAKNLELQRVRLSVHDADQVVHQAEMNRTRAEVKRAGAVARLAEEYGIIESDLSEKLENSPPPDAPALIARFKRELRAMGAINMGAIEAFERLNNRFQDLDNQRTDILGGVAEVENAVRELDELTREKFVSTFKAVQSKFSSTFARLFEGGLGRLVLTDEGDVLSSGIQIEVTLPGKKRQPLNLLSGGEQSLCTTALLFSLLQVKPSPLVVLDEIDAPLDGRNVERYASLLKDLSQEMQFIVITHNPTTIEFSDSWLGVTMQEPGVSTLVPAKFPTALPERSLPGNARSA